MENEQDEWAGYQPFNGFRGFCQHLIRFSFQMFCESCLGYVLGVTIGVLIFLLLRFGLL